jgi:hypothetical protein
MMIASMIAVELMRICFSALPTGPTGSRMPRLQADSSGIAAAQTRMRSLSPQPCRVVVVTNPRLLRFGRYTNASK